MAWIADLPQNNSVVMSGRQKLFLLLSACEINGLRDYFFPVPPFLKRGSDFWALSFKGSVWELLNTYFSWKCYWSLLFLAPEKRSILKYFHWRELDCTLLLDCSAQSYLFFAIFSQSGSSGNKSFFLIRQSSLGISLIYSTMYFSRWRNRENWGMLKRFRTPPLTGILRLKLFFFSPQTPDPSAFL